MPFVESFQATDEAGNQFLVNVNETIHKSLGSSRPIRDFSLDETGELLREDKLRPGHFIGINTAVRLRRVTE